MKKLSTLVSMLLGVICCPFLAAQQIPVFNHYVYNPYVYNPSYSGILGNKEVILIHRQQWVGFDDAPNSTILSGQFSLDPDNTFGLGGVLMRDDNFVNQRISLNVFPSVHLELATNHHVSLGINLGMVNHSLDFEKLQNPDIPSTLIDPLLSGGEQTNELHLDTGVGVNYLYDDGESQVSLGATLAQLALGLGTLGENANFNPRTHLLVNAHGRFPVSQDIYLEPMFLFKEVLGTLETEGFNPNSSGLLLGGGELDGLARLSFPELQNFWVSLGSRVSVSSAGGDGNGSNRWVAFNGGAGIDIGEQFQLSFVAEMHTYQPLSLEVGLGIGLGSPSSTTPSTTPPVQPEPVEQPQVVQAEKAPKEKKTKTRKTKTPKQRIDVDECDPLWRHSECLERELDWLEKRPSEVQVLPIIAADEVILIYKFSDNQESYMMNEWDRVESVISHIQDVLIRLRTGQEPLNTITKIQVTGKIKSSAGLLQVSSRIPYSGEFGAPLEEEILLDGQEEQVSIPIGNITRKQQLLLKQVSIAKSFGPNINPEYKVLSSQDISEDWEFSVEIRLSR